MGPPQAAQGRGTPRTGCPPTRKQIHLHTTGDKMLPISLNACVWTEQITRVLRASTHMANSHPHRAQAVFEPPTGKVRDNSDIQSHCGTRHHNTCITTEWSLLKTKSKAHSIPLLAKHFPNWLSNTGLTVDHGIHTRTMSN